MIGHGVTMTSSPLIWLGTGETQEGLPPGAPNGIWAADRDGVRLAAGLDGASFLSLHPSRDVLYAVEEASDGHIHAFDLSGPDLRQREAISSGGIAPCHLLLHPAGGWLYASNYGDGTLCAIALDDDGGFTGERVELQGAGSGPVADRQSGPHAHSALLSSDGGWLLVTDLGTDELRSYRLRHGRPDRRPVITRMPAGSGPRHLATRGGLLYLTCELDGMLAVLEWNDATGQAHLFDRQTVSGGPADGLYPSHLVLTDDAVLVAARGTSTVAIFALHEEGRRPSLVAEVATATWPRHMALIGEDLVVAGERANEVVWHSYAAGTLSTITHRQAVPRPMFVSPARIDEAGSGRG